MRVSYIGGSICLFYWIQTWCDGNYWIIGIERRILAIWLLGSTACCFMHRKKKNSLKRIVRTRFGTVVPIFDHPTNSSTCTDLFRKICSHSNNPVAIGSRKCSVVRTERNRKRKPSRCPIALFWILPTSNEWMWAWTFETSVRLRLRLRLLRRKIRRRAPPTITPIFPSDKDFKGCPHHCRLRHRRHQIHLVETTTKLK